MKLTSVLLALLWTISALANELEVLEPEISGESVSPACQTEPCDSEATSSSAQETTTSITLGPRAASSPTPAEDWPCGACYNYTEVTGSYWGKTDESRLGLGCTEYEEAVRGPSWRWYRLGSAPHSDSRSGAIAVEWCAPSEYCEHGYRLWLQPDSRRSFQQRSLACESHEAVLCLAPFNELYRNRCARPLQRVTALTCFNGVSDSWQVYKLPAERICRGSYCVRDPGDVLPPKPHSMCDQLQRRWDDFVRSQTVVAAKDVDELLEKNTVTIHIKHLRADYFSRVTIEFLENVIRNAILKRLSEQSSKSASEGGVGGEKRLNTYDVKLVNVMDVLRIVDMDDNVLSDGDYETRLVNDSVNLAQELLRITFAAFVDSPVVLPATVHNYDLPKELLPEAVFRWHLVDMSAVQDAVIERVNQTLTSTSVAIVRWSNELPLSMAKQLQVVRNATRNAAALADPWAAVKQHLNFFIAVAVVFGLCSLSVLLLYVCFRVQRFRQRRHSDRLTSPSLRSESTPHDLVATATLAAAFDSQAAESAITTSTANLVNVEPKSVAPKPRKDRLRKNKGEVNQTVDPGDIVPVSEQRYASYAEVEVHRQDLPNYHNGMQFDGLDYSDIMNARTTGNAAQDLSAVTKL